jgi:hypothetical protein
MDALAELNRIVARHSRDTVEPARRAEPIAASGGARAEARPARFEEPRPARFEEPRAPRTEPPQAAARANPPPRRAEPPAEVGGRGGWLSDLLGRAGREEPAQPAGDERQTRRAMESLDSLSVDIARMIDHDAAAELWERYKRGERNVFTRRLYTMQGQQTFEEIRKRYRADREFRQTVDRYIGEFERLLEEVSQGERGQATARSYLTSDTGKVYTMLAHAAGRLE